MTAGMAIVLALLVGLFAVPAPQSGIPTDTEYASEITELNGIGGYLREERLYVDPRAEMQLTVKQQQSLSEYMSRFEVPVYIAVLPQQLAVQAGGPDALLDELMNVVGERGVYLVASHYTARVDGTEGYEEARQIYLEVVNESSLIKTLMAFVFRIGAEYNF